MTVQEIRFATLARLNKKAVILLNVDEKNGFATVRQVLQFGLDSVKTVKIVELSKF